MSERSAVFLDRDGSIIEDTGYVAAPDAVRLLPGAADAIARLNQAGVPAVVVTNQSGIARGLLDEAAYLATARRLDRLLAAAGARLDAHYHCPHHPDYTGPCECRKPGPLLYRRAAADYGLHLASSWWVGDRLRDVLPAERFNGQGVLLGETSPDDLSTHAAGRFLLARDLAAAVDLVLQPLPRRPRYD
ncbi:MAG: D-glycero-alpha-D-manno-heptose-1,7-bisphosphate 7-phosphatase [Gemmatimonadales bacterium]